MCKIFALTDLTRVQVNEKLLNVIKGNVTKNNDHGFGYAVLSNNAEIGGERSVRVSDFQAFTKKGKSPNPAQNLPIVKKTSVVFGDLKTALASPKSLIAHGRFSTNTISLENTHPYFNDDCALIHNGVVDDAGGKMKPHLVTDNDTEILLRYWENEGMKGIEQNVTGYYAMAILEKQDGGVLNIIRDTRASLHIAWVRSIQSYMIATTSDIITGVCKGMKWKHDAIEAINDNCHAVFDGNQIISNTEIKPRVGVVTSAMLKQANQAFNSSETTWGGRWRDDDYYSGISFKNEEYAKELEELEALADEEDMHDIVPVDIQIKRTAPRIVR